MVSFTCHLHRSQFSGTGNDLARMTFHVPLAQVKKKATLKFLKTHGPDFQAEMPVAIHGITKCDFCQRPPDMNCGNQEEELLCCKDCNTKAHPSCMNYTPELALRVHQSPWQCPTCKPAMLVCYSCDKGFHVQCLYPPLDKSPSGELAIAGHWVCSMCSKQDIKDNDSSKLVSSSEELMTIKKGCSVDRINWNPRRRKRWSANNGGALVRVLDSMQQDFPRKRNLYEGPYPDVTDYTIEDVVKFFKSKGFTKEASAFSEQEIDGKSLLLMKRDDVLVGLRDYICLGPALKIFKHVERLQWASE
uniref:PHD-type domain-containing protein n=1 Tax=Octopus bimaculoides TaxID=37653 RepID=A0A0L8IFI3_OCTBM